MEPASAKLASPAPDPPLKAARVLIVDDENLFAAAVRRRLEKAGHACAVAGTLADAKAELDRQLADVVLLDLRLPNGNGMQFLEQLRRTPDSAAPVIVLTAHAEIDDAVHAMKQGAADYLKKVCSMQKALSGPPRNQFKRSTTCTP